MNLKRKYTSALVAELYKVAHTNSPTQIYPSDWLLTFTVIPSFGCLSHPTPRLSTSLRDKEARVAHA